MDKPIDISALLDQRQMNGFNRWLIGLSFLVTLFDGLDMMTVGFTAPYMSETMHLGKAMLGKVFSTGIFGMMLGSLLFAHLADRIGRRPAILGAAFAFSLLTMATALVQTYPALLAMRFLNGLAVGGMLPVAWALNIEFVPKVARGGVVTLIMFGYSLGSAIAGPVTNLVAPHHGWQAVYLLCGGASLVVSAVLAWLLPESIRFLVLHGRDGGQVTALLKRLEPSFSAPQGSGFTLSREPDPALNFNLAQLFDGPLARITPLLWLGYTLSSLAIYFVASWSPILIEALHYPRAQAAQIASISGLAGATLGIALTQQLERIGPLIATVCPIIAVVVLGAVAGQWGGETMRLVLLLLAGMLINASHYGILAFTALFYPSALRARGAGWATGVAKLGGVAGPMIGAQLLAAGVGASHTYGFLAVCPAILGMCIFGIARAAPCSIRNEGTIG